ncbi:MAG TPA: UvrD-helicase domain-containing protein [Acholeplasma sp.]|nr:UvrD-helicase domain-containing protein [Acholeplasma sp.]
MNLSMLNENQLKAVKHINGPLSVVAGAGSGKTRTLTYRIANLIEQGVLPLSILAVTFTNKAAREMKERVVELVGPKALDVTLSTFHSFCARFLRNEIDHLGSNYNRRFLIIDEDDAKQIIRDTVKELNYDPNRFKSTRLKSLISKFKNGQYDELDTIESEIYAKYNDYLALNNSLDFDDLINFTIKILKENKDVLTYYNNYYEYLLIDEFQDTNTVQYDLIKLLSFKHKNVFIVGDPDQSIYAFRGANYDNHNRFITDYKAEIVILDQNYRSTTNILDAANNLISNNNNRQGEKNLRSDFDHGAKVITELRDSDKDEAYYVARAIEIINQGGTKYENIAVLYRSNALSRIFEEAFLRYNIPYTVYGGISFFQRKEIKDMLSYIRVCLFPQDNISLKRIVNVPRRKIGQTTISKIETYANIHKISIWEAIDLIDLRGQAKKNLLEFKAVIEKLQKEILAVDDLIYIVDLTLEVTGYRQMLIDEGNEGKDRHENIMELKSVFYNGSMDYKGTNLEKIEQILDEMALKSDMDIIEDNNTVKLATIHQVKGLEFDAVFLVALEEGIFPSETAYNNGEIEEERRIAYVGATRAKKRLLLSCSRQRFRFGQIQYNSPSRFIDEMQIESDDFPKRPKIVVKELSPMDFMSNTDDIRSGDKVIHDKYGVGTVVQKDENVTRVAFSIAHGIKLFTNGHPSLKKVIN